MHTGHSFVTFLNKTRIESACHYLLTSNLSIKDIAYSCGFDSISHFNRTFKRLKDKSPSRFRKIKPQESSSPTYCSL
ncbi:helix-turn-helix domain-containing protein [Hyunsoonleella rubra]|uniref:Helix-turn-helix domain-containing protein n=1 Tax=Hyunsoonleella rubra TaxID=1737062 RepID=A0ABW5TCE0_9FLAO